MARLFGGLMSGTSCDGIDAALVEIDGRGLEMRVRFLRHAHRRYPATLRESLLAMMAPASVDVEAFCRMSTALALENAACLEQLLTGPDIDRASITAVGYHGQTLGHFPPPAASANADSTHGPIHGTIHGTTLQLGEPAVLARTSRLRVVSDFRAADMACGGQGAPLVPWTDHVLLRRPGVDRIVQNLGGIANLTYLPGDPASGIDDVVALDCGPGCMLIDEIVACASGGAKRMDRDGASAARGRASTRLVEDLLRDEYFRQPPPRSTGRERFGRDYARRFERLCLDRDLSYEDRLATAVLLTARAIARSVRDFLPPARLDREILVAGGGARNVTLCRSIAAETGVAVRSIEELGLPFEAKECVSFAMLAAAAVDGVAANLPRVTGAADRCVLGSTTPYTTAVVEPTARDDASSGEPRRSSLPADGALADGTVADGTVADGTVADGTVADGTVADGAVAELVDRSGVLTEQRNSSTSDIDCLSVAEAFDRMQAEDDTVAAAVAGARDSICRVVEATVAAFERGGRLFYFGAGTSGRLGVLDAAECPPTFRSPPEQVQGVIAGGADALVRSIEGAEDDRDAGRTAVVDRSVGAADVVVGISAGGTTPYVLAALEEAARRRATTAFVTCVPASSAAPSVDIDVRLLTGPEVVTGSTRLKAGTATKLALNRISTLAMIRTGKVFGNLMVDLNRDACAKLRDRALRIVEASTDLDREGAARCLDEAGDVKTAILMARAGIDRERASRSLAAAGGRLRAALERLESAAGAATGSRDP